MLRPMDDVRVGRILRALRRRRGWTQKELGRRAKVSQQAISLIERGHGGRLAVETVRRVFAALDARWEPTVSWRGGDLDRLLDEEHARLVGEISRRLARVGWDIAVEVTYSDFGDRGSVDVLAARRDLMAMVVVEVKSELVAVESTLRKLDEKVRIAHGSLGRERFGFRPRMVGRLLVLPSTNVARRRVARSSDVLDVALPDRAGRVRNWLSAPDGGLAGIQFVSDTNPGGDKHMSGGSKRVRTPRTSPVEHEYGVL
jgi:transcriptional regulator with XRE-family HTH domain